MFSRASGVLLPISSLPGPSGLRIDHSQGLVAYWEVPAGESTAFIKTDH